MVISNIDTGLPSKEVVDSLLNIVQEISKNTDTLAGFSGWVTWFSFVASIITIIGLGVFMIEVRKFVVGRKCQKRIIQDLIRHLFINNVISEAIKIRLDESNATIPKGILQRYCVLDSDIELQQLSFKAKNYEMLHSIRVKLRNYNISALEAEKHFTSSKSLKSIKLSDLDDIMTRSKRISKELIRYANSRYMRLSEDSIGKYIYEYYMDSERIPKYEREGKMDNSIVIPDRTGDWAFYDNLINEKSCSFNLKEIEDKMIRYRYKTYVNCI